VPCLRLGSLFSGRPKTDLGSLERSTAKYEQNQQDDDHQRQQSATDVHDKSPLLGLVRVHPWSLRPFRNTENKKADVAEHPKAFDHVGLLTNKPPGTAGLLSI
jgi:hypothetical protein